MRGSRHNALILPGPEPVPPTGGGSAPISPDAPASGWLPAGAGVGGVCDRKGPVTAVSFRLIQRQIGGRNHVRKGPAVGMVQCGNADRHRDVDGIQTPGASTLTAEFAMDRRRRSAIR